MKFNISPENGRKQFKIFLSRAKGNLKEAKTLLKEKSYRGAISRAYYGFFEAGHAALITKGFSAKTHAGLIALFHLHLVKTNQISAKFARLFENAKKAREQADYHFLKKFNQEETARIVKAAEEFIKEIEKRFKS